MKLHFMNKIIFAGVLGAMVFALASCQEVIYDNIRKEVKLEEGTISGDIRSIVRFKDFFYFANGAVYYKENTKNSHGQWNMAPSPEGHVLKLAADANYLYAFCATSQIDDEKGENVQTSRKLYFSADGKTWTECFDLKNTRDVAYLFCTNTIKPENRKAYLTRYLGRGNAENKVFLLDGEKQTSLELGTDDAKTLPECRYSDGTICTKSCVSVGGTVYFFRSHAACTNERYDSDGKTVIDGTIYFYGRDAHLKWGKAGTELGSFDGGNVIYSLGVTQDYVLAGTGGGIKHYSFNIPGNAESGLSSTAKDFSSNADSTMSSGYQVLSLLVVNPEKAERNTAIYSSIVYSGTGSSTSAQFSHVGLWAYYPDRANWNRE